MLSQRKLSWSDRKKKPKSEMTSGKCGASYGKASYPASRFHKTSGCRPHEGRKMAYYEVTSSSLALRGPSGTGRTLKKNAGTQGQFLPPIMSTGADNCLSKQSGCVLDETLFKGPMDGEGLRSSTSSRHPGKENLEYSNHEDTLTPISSPSCVVRLTTCHWDTKTFGLDDLGKSPVKKAETPDLYGSCFLVPTSRSGGEKDSKTQQVPDSLRRIVSKSPRWNKATRRGLSIWRDSEELNGKKGGEKRSSGDSAFGTDTWSENAEVDIELGLEICTVEMDYYTQQRIMNWILQVNSALFSPHPSENLKCPLTEQDTSIKIVYDGD